MKSSYGLLLKWVVAISISLNVLFTSYFSGQDFAFLRFFLLGLGIVALVLLRFTKNVGEKENNLAPNLNKSTREKSNIVFYIMSFVVVTFSMIIINMLWFAYHFGP